MKNIVRNLLYPVLFIIVFFFAWQALAQSGKALVVVRFNQPNVYFDQSLYQAVSQAVAIKPGVMFNVVSYAPETGDRASDERWQEVSSANTRKVVASMNQMGVPMSRIQVSGQRMAGIKVDETHVFVR